MTTNRTPVPPTDDIPASLLLALRGLRRDEQPRRELWTGIARRVADVADAAQPTRWPTARRRRAPTIAAAAMLVLALGAGWHAARLPGPDRMAADGGSVPLLVREADALDREYDGALREALATRAGPPPADAELGLLDRSAAEIRAALAADPNATFLLDQLRRVRARRLELTLEIPRLP